MYNGKGSVRGPVDSRPAAICGVSTQETLQSPTADVPSKHERGEPVEGHVQPVAHVAQLRQVRLRVRTTTFAVRLYCTARYDLLKIGCVAAKSLAGPSCVIHSDVMTASKCSDHKQLCQ